MERSYKIAGIVVNMDTWGKAEIHGRPYEIEYTDRPQMYVYGKQGEAVEEEEGDRGKAFIHFSESFIEYTATATSFYNKILDFDAMLLHSSAVVIDGKAYLFTADAGTGKSTHTALYRRVFGDDRARILNDDKPVLRLEDGEIVAYGTPWSGKTDMNLNLRVPLGGICCLRRGAKNTIRKMGKREALFELLGQTLRPEKPELADKLLDLLGILLAQTDVWEMHCNMDPEAAIVSYEAMSGMRKEDIK